MKLDASHAAALARRASRPPRSPPSCSRRACATSGCAAPGRCGRARRGSSAAPSRCASCRRAKIWPRPHRGPRRARPGPPSRRCRPAASPSSTPWASPTPGSSATSSARAWRSAAWPRWSPTAWCATSPACSRRGPAGLVQRVAAPPSVAGLTFVGWQEPIGCGGVAVFPDDVVVADEDGAVVIPAALLDDVLAAGAEQERLEAWIMGEVARGVPLPGLYPPNAETKARYEAGRDPAGDERIARPGGLGRVSGAVPPGGRRHGRLVAAGARSRRSGSRCRRRSRLALMEPATARRSRSGRMSTGVSANWCCPIPPAIPIRASWAGFTAAGTPVGALAEFLAAALNPNLGGREHAPVYVERQVHGMVAPDLGPAARATSGLLVGGTSMATVIGLAVARQVHAGGDVRREGCRSRARRLVGYASREAHGCIAKAFELLGLGRDSLRLIPADAEHACRLSALVAAIAADRYGRVAAVLPSIGDVPAPSTPGRSTTSRRWPTSVASNGSGSTSTRLSAGLAVLVPELAPRLAGIERADSLAFDFHKWLHVPYEAGCMLIRDEAAASGRVRAAARLSGPGRERARRRQIRGSASTGST